MMRCQKTHADDIPALSRLWTQAFGDTDEEIARFFREAFPHAIGFAARDGETLAGMCFALPQQVVCGEAVYSSAYLYAVATDAAYRGQGVCRALLAFAEKELKKRGIQCLTLVPADEGLAAMYEKMGFSGPLRRERESAAPSSAGQAQPVTPIEYAGLRETALWDIAHVRYDKAQLEYAMAGGKFYCLMAGYAMGCAAVKDGKDGVQAVVCELLPGTEGLGALAEKRGAGKYEVVSSLPGEDGETWCMLKWLGKPDPAFEPVYMGFSLE